MRQETTQITAWKVGDLAERTGLSVRTLHYYDEIGLLPPSGRTDSGHRLYSAGDVLYLQQIRSLRALGFGLEQIGEFLEKPDFSVREAIELHVLGLKEQIRLREELLRRLEAVAARLRSAEETSSKELVRTAMEVIEMSEKFEKYYTPEQLEALQHRREEVGEEKIRAAEAEWTDLMEQVRQEMKASTDPSSERVQDLAKRWMELVNEFTGGDPSVERPVANMWQQEETIYGIDTVQLREMIEYISRAMAASSPQN